MKTSTVLGAVRGSSRLGVMKTSTELGLWVSISHTQQVHLVQNVEICIYSLKYTNWWARYCDAFWHRHLVSSRTLRPSINTLESIPTLHTTTSPLSCYHYINYILPCKYARLFRFRISPRKLTPDLAPFYPQTLLLSASVFIEAW